MSRSPASPAPILPPSDGVGFSILRVKGSHHFMRHEDGRSTVVPVHSGETIGPGLFHKILRDCQLSADQFAELIQKRITPETSHYFLT